MKQTNTGKFPYNIQKEVMKMNYMIPYLLHASYNFSKSFG